jgi:hypothetical protein
MNDSSTIQLKGPREALSQFVAEVCRDLEASHSRLTAADTTERLVEVATQTHQTLVGHGQTMGEFVQIVRDWRHDTL